MAERATRHARRRYERWTAEEDAVLRAAPPGADRRELAMRLRRTTEAVNNRICRLRRQQREAERVARLAGVGR